MQTFPRFVTARQRSPWRVVPHRLRLINPWHNPTHFYGGGALMLREMLRVALLAAIEHQRRIAGDGTGRQSQRQRPVTTRQGNITMQRVRTWVPVLNPLPRQAIPHRRGALSEAACSTRRRTLVRSRPIPSRCLAHTSSRFRFPTRGARSCGGDRRERLVAHHSFSRAGQRRVSDERRELLVLHAGGALHQSDLIRGHTDLDRHASFHGSNLGT